MVNFGHLASHCDRNKLDYMLNDASRQRKQLGAAFESTITLARVIDRNLRVSLSECTKGHWQKLPLGSTEMACCDMMPTEMI